MSKGHQRYHNNKRGCRDGGQKRTGYGLCTSHPDSDVTDTVFLDPENKALTVSLVAEVDGRVVVQPPQPTEHLVV